MIMQKMMILRSTAIRLAVSRNVTAAAGSGCDRSRTNVPTSSITSLTKMMYGASNRSLFSSSSTSAKESVESGDNNDNEQENDKERLKKRKELEDLPVTFSDISRANVAIRGGIQRTECIQSYFLSELIGANIYLKPEFRQFTGSFKERGARNAILQLMRDNKSGQSLNGVIAASAGNHALALAYHGKELGVPVTVVMPVVAPLAKVDKCRVSRISFPVSASSPLAKPRIICQGLTAHVLFFIKRRK